MRGRLALQVIIAAVALGSLAQPAISQSTAALAQLNGTVQDERGAVITKATITLREMDTNRSYSATSNDNGYYAVPNVPPGRYEIKVAYSGFANFTQTGLQLSVGQTATLNVILKISLAPG